MKPDCGWPLGPSDFASASLSDWARPQSVRSLFGRPYRRCYPEQIVEVLIAFSIQPRSKNRRFQPEERVLARVDCCRPAESRSLLHRC